MTPIVTHSLASSPSRQLEVWPLLCSLTCGPQVDLARLSAYMYARSRQCVCVSRQSTFELESRPGRESARACKGALLR